MTSTPKFITLTDTDGNKERVNADHITWYTANRKGGSRVLLIDHDSANYYAEPPEQIDAMLGVDGTKRVSDADRASIRAVAFWEAMAAVADMIDPDSDPKWPTSPAAVRIAKLHKAECAALSAATGTGEA
ncbi:hypothetical protein [Azospirillum tabaci]|uniref:hypothetical protein n=1 Tax=Azospirillum tabaci TaxID=2752310 RepID=UPI0016606A23|nr:hypothetical protein [Azospirillum tabaci]